MWYINCLLYIYSFSLISNKSIVLLQRWERFNHWLGQMLYNNLNCWFKQSFQFSRCLVAYIDFLDQRTYPICHEFLATSNLVSLFKFGLCVNNIVQNIQINFFPLAKQSVYIHLLTDPIISRYLYSVFLSFWKKFYSPVLCETRNRVLELRFIQVIYILEPCM